MNLIIDIGNTSCKFAVFNDNHLIDSDIADCKPIAATAATRRMTARHNITNCIASTVSMPCCVLDGVLSDVPGVVMEFTSSTPIPIKNGYATPQTLGNDRLAAAVGAAHLYPGRNTLIIDAGTAITYDYVRDGREFAGGNISPGISMRLKALHEYTSRLPLIDNPQTTDSFGLCTQEAISNGVITGVLHEIEGYIDDFEKKNVNSKIILTGGSSIFLSKKLKNTIFAEPNLVTIGLNRILNYNVLKEN